MFSLKEADVVITVTWTMDYLEAEMLGGDIIADFLNLAWNGITPDLFLVGVKFGWLADVVYRQGVSEKLDAISFFEQRIGGDMVFVMMGVDYHFYTLVLQEIGQLLGGVGLSTVYQETVNEVSTDTVARVKLRIAVHFDLGYLFKLDSFKQENSF
jgi:hypothetical protein